MGIKAISPVDPDLYTNGTVELEEAASQSFKRGKIVTINASGYVEAATLGTAATYFGVAAEDAHNTSSAGDKKLLIWPITTDSRFEFTFSDALAQTDIGLAVGVTNDATSGFDRLDRDDTSDEVFILDYVRGPGGAEIGDSDARVIGRFDADFIQLHD